MSDNNILIFGGTSGTGLAAAQVLAGRGDAVTVAVRESSDTAALKAAGAKTVLTDVFSSGRIREAFASGNFDAVVISLSGQRGDDLRADREGAINIIDVARELGVKRVLMVTGIGCGDSRGAVAPKVIEVLGAVLDAKAVAEDHLMASGLAWTILRPGGLTNDPASGTAIRSTDRNTMGVANRADVGALVVECIDDPDSAGEIYATVDPEIKWQAPLQRGDDLPQSK